MLTREQVVYQEKLQEQMEKFDLDALILSHPETVFYATGTCNHIMYATFRVGMGLAVVPRKGKVTLVCSNYDYQAASISAPKDVDFRIYPIWTYIEDLDDGNEMKPQPDPNQTWRIASEAIREKCPEIKRIGVERTYLPYDRMVFLQETFGKETIVDGTDAIVEARAIKTPWEIDCMRKAADATHRAMFEVAQNTHEGLTEAEMVNLWNKACANQGPDYYDRHSVHAFADMYSPVVIPRKDVILKEGDIVKLDGTMFYQGYISDISRSYVVGDKVDPRKEEIYATLLEAQDMEFKMAGPGARIDEIFNTCLEIVKKKFPNYKRGHFGHSIGCNKFPEEAPFITGTEKRVMKPGMVFCFEVPYYSSMNGSYNLEDEIVITETGIERLCAVPRTLKWKTLYND